MKFPGKGPLLATGFMLLFLYSCTTAPAPQPGIRYEPTWESLKQHDIPQWLKDAKFGIYTHWGVYCYTATNSNATWNLYQAYRNPDSRSSKEFTEKFGTLSTEFGYKDLIPKFTAEKFDAEEWADLFARSGAKFAGPVAEHHDGFAMWDTQYSDWNAAKMGPKRDIVGELEKAIKARNMKFVTAFHHAANWYWYPTTDTTKDCSNPEFTGLYGPIHEPTGRPNKEFLDEWYNKLIEVVDKYDPDFMWFDFELDLIREDYVKEYIAYYYNKAAERGKDVLIRSLVSTKNDKAEMGNQINYPGYYLYPDEIKSVTMLGDGAELNWEMVEGAGLRITPPDTKPCEHAFVIRIERKQEIPN